MIWTLTFMLQTTFDEPAPAGSLAKVVRHLFMRTARVAEVQVLSPHFRLITLAGDALKGVNWVPGQKIQVAMQGLATRTYTPMCWDAQEGVTRLVGYAHGNAPGARWLQTAMVGDACQFLGPRRSIELDRIPRPSLVFGDETSFALAYAMRYSVVGASGLRAVETPGVSFLFEVNSLTESQAVFDAVGITDAAFIERKMDDAHWPAVEARAVDYFEGRGRDIARHYVLTGKSTSVQRVLRFLRAQSVRPNQLATKAYWAPGKVGLD